MNLWMLLTIVLLISMTAILAQMEVKAERRTFDFFKKQHHHHDKHRKEDHHGHYLDDATDFEGYHQHHHHHNHHDSAIGYHYGGHYPIVHIHTYGGGIHGHGIGGSGIYAGGIHGGGYSGGTHYGSGLSFNEGLLNNNLHAIPDEGVYGHYDGEHSEVHGFVGLGSHHVNHLL